MKNRFGTKLVALLILGNLNVIGQNMVQDGNFALDTSLNNPVLNGLLDPSSPWTVTSSAGTVDGVSMIPLPNTTLAPLDPQTDGSPDRGVGQAPYFLPGTTTQTLSQNVSGFVSGNIYEVSFDLYVAYPSENNSGTPGISVTLGNTAVAIIEIQTLPVPSSPSDAHGWFHYSGITVPSSSGSLPLDINFTANQTSSKDIILDRVYVGTPVSDCLDLLCPTDMVVATCSNSAVVNFSAMTWDLCCTTTPDMVTYNLGGVSIGTNYNFPIGVSTVQVLATNVCRLSNACSFTVTVIQITNPPVIFSCPTNITICTNSTGCGYMPDDTSEVFAGLGRTVTQSIAPGTLICSETNVIFTVSDPCGNVVETNVPCTLIDCGSNCLQIQCWTNMVLTSCSNVPVYYNPTATDTCCSNWTVVCTPPSGSVFSPDTVNTVTVVATDDCGNSNSCSFTVNVDYVSCSNNCLQIQDPANILIDSCTNILVDYPQLAITDLCCSTNYNVVFDPPSGTSFAPDTRNIVNWFVYDCSGTNYVAAGSFLVTVLCTNCCEGPITNYTVTVVQGTNYLADCLCQGTSNTLADVLPSVPVGTEVYFWNPPAGQFNNPPDVFQSGGWKNGTEQMFPGEGFLLVSFASSYQLTIYGIQPGCGGGCTPMQCYSDTVLVGDYGVDLNPVPFCDLFCCAPPAGTQVQTWDPTSQSFTTSTYTGLVWLPPPPALSPPSLAVGYSEFVSVNKSSPVITCPGPIMTNSCGNIVVNFTVTASNAYGGTLTATASPASGSSFGVGTTIVTCTVTNPCGDVSSCAFPVTVNCPTNGIITTTTSGGSLIVSWQANQGWILQAQTNMLIPNGWTTVTGTLNGSYTLKVDPTRPVMFFRLKFP